jgi:heme exporter protein B
VKSFETDEIKEVRRQITLKYIAVVFGQIITLLGLELRLEFRQRASIAGVLLFAIGTVYLFSLAFGSVEPRLWNALFWIILLFGAVNGLGRSFSRELTYRYSYYQQLTSPLSLYVAKVLFNTLFLLVIGTLVWGMLSLLFGNPVRDVGLFVITLCMASLGLSLILTFLALVAGRVNNGPGIVAILAFPVVIPLLLTVVKLGAVALRLIQQTSTSKDLLLLFGVDLLAIGLALLLVPSLWKEA